tara:strand:+ start:498 stop:932 length:435 start_codon:yes stop_codon:yes gene_type:complete
MLDYNEYINIGGIIIVLVLVCLIMKEIYKINGSSTNPFQLEGFSATDGSATAQENEKLIEDMKNNTEQIIDNLHLVKYRKDWENLIIATESRISALTLSMLPSLGKALQVKNNDKAVKESISNLNQLNQCRDTLNETMKYLDGL